MTVASQSAGTGTGPLYVPLPGKPRVDSGRNLLAKARTLSDLVMLENEVATHESNLASLQAK